MKFAASLLKVSFLCLTLFSLALRALGQADQSKNFTPPLAIYQGSNIDTVSHPNENVHLSIPLLHLKGRGLDLDINATYNSNIWSTSEFDDPATGIRFFYTTNSSPAWSVGVSRMGTVSSFANKCTFQNSNGDCQSYVYYAQFQTSEGSTIELGDDNGIYTSGPLPTRFWSNDGTYMRIPNASWAANGLEQHIIVPKLLYEDGVSLNQQYNSQRYVDTTSLEDTNGNSISCSVDPLLGIPYTCTDTVGRVVTFNYEANSSRVSSISYQDSNGTTQTVRFIWMQPVNLDLPWAWSAGDDPGCVPPPPFGSGTPSGCYGLQVLYSQLLKTITYPNGQSYSFEYVTNPSGTTTGQVSKM
jgi:hypothetical protein